MAHLNEMEVFCKTLYMECRGEPEQGMRWVAWVIKNRANRGGQWPSSIKGVCLQKWQFECWNNCDDCDIRESGKYETIKSICREVYNASMSRDPTGGCCYYNNPAKETADWINNVTLHKVIGHHYFYRD